MTISPDRADTFAGHDGHSTRPAAPEPVGVLIVDDDGRVRAAIRETIALETDLVVVGEAADAVTAATVATATMPAVALVDVLLPDAATGLALITALTRRPACSVVAMSVRSANRDPALLAGAVAFIEKGIEIDALLQAVRAAARSYPEPARKIPTY